MPCGTLSRLHPMAMRCGPTAWPARLPFFYEVRGFWEITRLAAEPAWADSPDYRKARAMEQAVARRAQRLFTLNRFMRDELVRGGGPADRVDLVPNGFDGWASAPGGADALRQQLGIQAKHVVGYIGSFNAYEGLEDATISSTSKKASPTAWPSKSTTSSPPTPNRPPAAWSWSS